MRPASHGVDHAAASTVAASSTPATPAHPQPQLPPMHPTSAPQRPPSMAPRKSVSRGNLAAAATKPGEVSMDQVKLLFGSIDVQSLGYITRYQFEETLRDAGISFSDARLTEVKARLEEAVRASVQHQHQAHNHAVQVAASAAVAAQAAAGKNGAGGGVRRNSIPDAVANGSSSSSSVTHGSDPRPSSMLHRTSSPLFANGHTKPSHTHPHTTTDGGGRIDLATFAHIIAPNAPLIERVIKRQLVIPDWDSFTAILRELYEETKGIEAGKVADYIPELALADPAWFGVSFCSIDGQLFSIGDTTREFSVQSSSKPISYLMALDELGEEEVHRYVGREPSGLNFNDIALNPEQIPHNPMVNSGAIMTCSLIRHGQEQSARFRAIMDVWTKISGEQKYVTFSNSTYLSERATADRNFCLGFLMQEHRSFDIGRQPKSGMPAFSIASSRTHLTPGRSWGANDLVKNLELYFQCCSIQTTAEGQAVIGATLASGGRCALTDKQLFSGSHVRNCLSLMLSCGMYDYSGEWAYKIGLPAKSGVSGCLMVVIPNVGGLSIYSPALDALGNTVRGIELCKRLVDRCSFGSFTSATYACSSSSSKVNPLLPRNSAWQNELITLCTLCAKGDLTGIRAVLSGGADANGADYDGRTPLHLAASEGQLAVVKYLCATSDLKLNPVDRWGGTPFSDAVREGHQAVAEYLFAKLKQQGITPQTTQQQQQSQQQQSGLNNNASTKAASVTNGR